MIATEILQRKGARKAQEIPKEVQELLNKGVIETVNLTEWLAVNQSQLIENQFPQMDLNQLIQPSIQKIKNQKKPTAMSTTKVVGEVLANHCQDQNSHQLIIGTLLKQTSDVLRSYASYIVALHPVWTIREKLEQSRSIVADTHFGVREIVWMALRPEIEKELIHAVDILADWTPNDDENIRRFTTEVSRPRGVWCKHIDQLKEEPEIALPILEPLKSDPAKYVQDSVSNWLNDASKSRPDFVVDLCSRWLQESPTKETEKIVKRARRTLDKK